MLVFAAAMIINCEDPDRPASADILAKLRADRRRRIDDVRIIATGEVLPGHADRGADRSGLGKLMIIAEGPLISGVIGNLVAPGKETVRSTRGKRNTRSGARRDRRSDCSAE